MHFFMPEKMKRLDMLPVILVYIFSAWNNIFFSFTIRYTQARDFSGFYRNSGFLNFFCLKIHFWYSGINEEKIEWGLGGGGGIIIHIYFIK